MNESALFPKLLRIQDNEMCTVCRGHVPRDVVQKNGEKRRVSRDEGNEGIVAETTNHAAFEQYRRYRVNVYVCMYMRMFECV